MKSIFNSPIDSELVNRSSCYQQTYDLYRSFEDMLENDSPKLICNEEIIALATLGMAKLIQVRNILTSIDAVLINNLPPHTIQDEPTKGWQGMPTDTCARAEESKGIKPSQSYGNVNQTLMILGELYRTAKANGANSDVLNEIEEKIIKYVKLL